MTNKKDERVLKINAIKEIEDVDFRSDSNGGRGAVYEFCKWLLEKKNNE